MGIGAYDLYPGLSIYEVGFMQMNKFIYFLEHTLSEL
jgi:hypothetical protein